MREIQKICKVMKSGNSLSVPLTKQLQLLGIKKGDCVYIYCCNDAIIIKSLKNKEEQ